jgi:hypothetical protein
MRLPLDRRSARRRVLHLRLRDTGAAHQPRHLQHLRDARRHEDALSWMLILFLAVVVFSLVEDGEG